MSSSSHKQLVSNDTCSNEDSGRATTFPTKGREQRRGVDGAALGNVFGNSDTETDASVDSDSDDSHDYDKADRDDDTYHSSDERSDCSEEEEKGDVSREAPVTEGAMSALTSGTTTPKRSSRKRPANPEENKNDNDDVQKPAAKKSRDQISWTNDGPSPGEDSHPILTKWLAKPDMDARRRASHIRGSGISRKQFANEVLQAIRDAGITFNRSVNSMRQRIRKIEIDFEAAEQYLRANPSLDISDPAVRTEVLSICPDYFVLHPVMKGPTAVEADEKAVKGTQSASNSGDATAHLVPARSTRPAAARRSVFSEEASTHSEHCKLQTDTGTKVKIVWSSLAPKHRLILPENPVSHFQGQPRTVVQTPSPALPRSLRRQPSRIAAISQAARRRSARRVSDQWSSHTISSTSTSTSSPTPATTNAVHSDELMTRGNRAASLHCRMESSASDTWQQYPPDSETAVQNATELRLRLEIAKLRAETETARTDAMAHLLLKRKYLQDAGVSMADINVALPLGGLTNVDA